MKAFCPQFVDTALVRDSMRNLADRQHGCGGWSPDALVAATGGRLLTVDEAAAACVGHLVDPFVTYRRVARPGSAHGPPPQVPPPPPSLAAAKGRPSAALLLTVEGGARWWQFDGGGGGRKPASRL